MCARYLIDDEAYAGLLEMIMPTPEDMSSAAGAHLSAPAGEVEIFPSNTAPVIARGGAEAMKWGFPHWKNQSVIINARSETALEKSMFKKPLMERRCVVPSCGFFEWRRTSGGKKKDKFLLRRPDEHMLYMAGMVNIFRDAAGADYSAFVILTTAANDSVSPIHDRMPLIVAADELDQWINDNRFMEYALGRTGPELIATLI